MSEVDAPMYRLHYFPGNASIAPHAIMREIGVPFELVLVDRKQNAQKSAEYLRLNPNGRIPTMEINGDILWEAAAMVLHLCDLHPQAGLAPAIGTRERAQFYKWLIWMTNTIQPEFLVYHYPHRHAETEAAVAEVKRVSETRLESQFDIAETALADGREWLLGDRFSALDIYLTMLSRWGRNCRRPPRSLPHLGPYLKRVLARPAVHATFEAEGLADPWV